VDWCHLRLTSCQCTRLQHTKGEDCVQKYVNNTQNKTLENDSLQWRKKKL
jgi:hypothetical protein